jgi:hypothetical protein
MTASIHCVTHLRMTKGFRSVILVEIPRPLQAESLYILIILKSEILFQRRNTQHGKTLFLHELHPFLASKLLQLNVNLNFLPVGRLLGAHVLPLS